MSTPEPASVAWQWDEAAQGVVQNLPILGNTRARKSPSCEGRISVLGCLVREAGGLPGSSSLGLKRSKVQKGEPVRMALPRHQFSRTLAVTPNMPASHEAAVVQEELQ
jgi:hypothetical protein